MTEDEGRSPPAEDGLLHLNRRQAWQLLDLDTLFIRSKRGTAKFGWERLLTGISCYATISRTGIFGEPESYPTGMLNEILRSSEARELLKDYPVFRSLFANEVQYSLVSDGSFPRAAAFLDIASDWIRCDDLYTFLSGPSPRVVEIGAAFSYVNAMRRALSPLVYKLGDAVAKETALKGFFKYIDLSVDIFDFVMNDRGLHTGRWFMECLSSWFNERRADRVLQLLSLFDEIADPNTQEDSIWHRRRVALSELSRLASENSVETVLAL
jgi:hypothetical protein